MAIEMRALGVKTSRLVYDFGQTKSLTQNSDNETELVYVLMDIHVWGISMIRLLIGQTFHLCQQNIMDTVTLFTKLGIAIGC